MICLLCQKNECSDYVVNLQELQQMFGVVIETDETDIKLCEECFNVYQQAKQGQSGLFQ